MWHFKRELYCFGKSIVPFCTHGGGGAGHIAKDAAKFCTGCDVLPLLAVQGDGGAKAESLVEQWPKQIGK